MTESAFRTFWCFDLAQHRLRYPNCRILRLREIRAEMVSQGDAAQCVYRIRLTKIKKGSDAMGPDFCPALLTSCKSKNQILFGIKHFKPNYESGCCMNRFQISKIVMLLSFSLFFLLSLLSCKPSYSVSERSIRKAWIAFYVKENALVAENLRAKTRKLLALNPKFDKEVSLSAGESRCLYFSSASHGLHRICFEKDEITSPSDLKAELLDAQGLPKRLWRAQRPHTTTWKHGIKYRTHKNGLHFWMSDYALSYRSSDKSGKIWQSLRLGRTTFDTISDLAAFSQNGITEILVSSPYNGLRKTALHSQHGKLQVASWRRVGRGLPVEEYVPGLFFYESTPALQVCGNHVYAGTGFGQGLYSSDNQGETFRRLKLTTPGLTHIHEIHCLEPDPQKEKSQHLLAISGTDFALLYDPINEKVVQHIFDASLKSELQEWLQQIRGKTDSAIWLYNPIQGSFFHIARKPTPRKAIARVNGIYLPAHKTTARHLNLMLPYMKKAGLNAIVVDLKDDFGNLVYNSSLSIAKEAGAIRPIIPVKKLADYCKSNNLRFIARLVVFKDKKLFFYKNKKYAYRRTDYQNIAWQFLREYWVDAYSEDIWDYNIAIAKELEILGVDEIQFDYIRFPSDGPRHLIRSMFQPGEDSLKPETLSDFLQRADKQINIPIGIDVYGFNAWYRAGAVIGQDVSMLAEHVQVVSPMYYPSHFGNRWYMKGPRSQRSYRILYDGSVRALNIVQGKAEIRPYIQAFRLLAPTYGADYIQNQVHGVNKADATGYYFWNAAGKYSDVFHALQQYDVRTYLPK